MNTHIMSVAQKLSCRSRSHRKRRALPNTVKLRDDQAVKKSALRILGPYNEKDGHRLIVVENGRRKSLKFPTPEQAVQVKAQLLGELTKRTACTIGEALAEYEQALITERGRLAYTVRDEHSRLSLMLPVDEPIQALTAERATQVYRASCERLGRNGRPLSVDSLYFLLKSAKRFSAWCIERGYLSTNPFAKIRRAGRTATGKTQLTADEARRFLETALQMAEAGNLGAVAVALQLSLGLRSSEVLARRVRDIDEGGTVLLIGHGKTTNARRRPEIPEFLRHHLLKLADGKPADAFLFGTRPNGGQRATSFLIQKVHQVCERAGVPKVCAHSLRGLHATLALRQGVSPQAVAAALGHGSFAVTARHYAEPTQLLNTRVGIVVAALHEPSNVSDAGLPKLASTLCANLSAPQVEQLVRLLNAGISIKHPTVK